MSSHQYRKSHCGDKTVVISSYLHNGISYTGTMTSLYWFSPMVVSIAAYGSKYVFADETVLFKLASVTSRNITAFRELNRQQARGRFADVTFGHLPSGRAPPISHRSACRWGRCSNNFSVHILSDFSCIYYSMISGITDSVIRDQIPMTYCQMSHRLAWWLDWSRESYMC